MNIRNFWEDSFHTFGLSTEKLTMMMRDNASYGIKACNNWGIRHFGCIGHSIHLVIGLFLIEKHKKKAKASAAQDDCADDIDDDDDDDGVDDDEDDDTGEYNVDDLMLEETSDHVHNMQKIVAKVCIIARYIKNSPKAKEKVRSY
jgi:hypothetical protein